MTTAIIAVLGVLMVSAAVLALLHKSLVTAILSAGVVSLVASVIYLFLAAPDVAMTAIESISGAVYVAIGILGIVLVAGVVDQLRSPEEK